MKNSLIFIIWLGICLSACMEDGYTLRGEAEGMEGKSVYLVVSNDEGADTLVRTVVKDGKFVIRGKVDEILPATVAVEGMWFAFVFLENGSSFDVRFLPGQMPEVRSDGATQQLYEGFVEISMNAGKEENISEKMLEAMRSNDDKKIAEVQAEMQQIQLQAEENRKAYCREHGNTYFGLYQLWVQALNMDAVTAKKLFDLCSDELKATSLGKRVEEKIRTLETLAVGAKVPDCTAHTPEGDTISLYGLKAKVKLIDFWSSTCGRCRVENKLLIPFYKEYHAEGFEILSISLDKKHDAWVKAIERDGLPWPQASDLKGTSSASLAAFYGVPSLPYTILVDADNRVIARDIHYEQLKDCVPGLLKR